MSTEATALHPLAQWRREKGLTAEQFAVMIDVRSPISVYRYEKGKRVPRPKVMAKITKATEGRLTANDFASAAE